MDITDMTMGKGYNLRSELFFLFLVTKCTYSDQNGKTIEINVNATYRHLTDCTDCKCLTSGVVECCA